MLFQNIGRVEFKAVGFVSSASVASSEYNGLSLSELFQVVLECFLWCHDLDRNLSKICGVELFICTKSFRRYLIIFSKIFVVAVELAIVLTFPSGELVAGF